MILYILSCSFMDTSGLCNDDGLGSVGTFLLCHMKLFNNNERCVLYMGMSSAVVLMMVIH